ncbi:hypothetical protein CA895_23265 [Escherichia coli]|nr:hypothetical protein CA895_23265 [Escherichia coli]CBJ03422.1 putative transmembrane protein [Escherichia coli ETEC H10407]
MFQCINQLFAFSLSFIHFPFEKVGIYVTNTSLMATYGGQFTLTFSPPIGYFYGNDNYHWRNCSFAAIIVVGLLCKSISTSKNSVAQFCMVLLLAPLLGVAGYIIYTGIELFSNVP